MTPNRYHSGEMDVTGGITRVGDAGVRITLHDAAQKHETGDRMHFEVDDQGPITEIAEPKMQFSRVEPVLKGSRLGVTTVPESPNQP